MRYLVPILSLWLPYLAAAGAWFLWTGARRRWLSWTGAVLFWIAIAVVIGWFYQFFHTTMWWYWR